MTNEGNGLGKNIWNGAEFKTSGLKYYATAPSIIKTDILNQLEITQIVYDRAPYDAEFTLSMFSNYNCETFDH